MLITGWILSILPAGLFLFSAAMKFMKPPAVVEGMTHLGYPEKLVLALGILEITCTILYLIPPTAILGAIVLAVVLAVPGGVSDVPSVFLRLRERFRRGEEAEPAHGKSFHEGLRQ